MTTEEKWRARIAEYEVGIDENAALAIAKLEQERDAYRKLVLLLQEENERLKRGLLGQKAERLPKNDAQLSSIESDPERATFTLTRIGALFRIERTA